MILADLTCKLLARRAGRWIDPRTTLCALKLGGWAPIDLLLHGAEEARARTGPKRSASPTSPRRARAICSSSRRSATVRTKAAGSIR